MRTSSYAAIKTIFYFLLKTKKSGFDANAKLY